MTRYTVLFWEDGELIGTTDSLGEAEAWVLDDELDGYIMDNKDRTGWRINVNIAEERRRKTEYDLTQTLLGYPVEDED